ncbi:MAG TPA: putative Ig domain-containing protein [Acidobacteriota bacterium]|nr:putative Ig domain-containing protein [Acidobacteriota bacterium]HNT17029.1 putative Ig domain-containing protein [Acidobacteriota bacterium]HPA26399.1 putative Ig domain-containing protein [Acidobacteriota bacterium]HQO19305.1 putative Ig domain-containing protein [Acidobacteriota bacterium]HQQ46514.1 putative Ig domain-containing protein [Acidobacteriota bacterium]
MVRKKGSRYAFILVAALILMLTGSAVSAQVTVSSPGKPVLLGDFTGGPRADSRKCQAAGRTESTGAFESLLPDSPGQVGEQTDPPSGSKAPVSLVLDDGTVENNIGIGGSWEMLWVNRFTPAPGEFPFNLTEMQIYFESAGAVNIGDDIVLVVYENTTGNSDPAVGSNLIYTQAVTVQALDAWNIFTLTTPVAFTGPGDVIIGAIGLEVPGTSYWPAAIDQTATQGRSWAGWYLASPPPASPTLPPDDTWILIDTYFPGNWLIRGVGATGSCVPFYEQPLSTINTSAWVDQDFPDIPAYSSYLADDFTNAAPWTIDVITTPGDGWNSFTTLMNATSLNWAIYADNAGIPAGYPGDGVTTPEWSLSLSPGDASVVLSNGTLGLPSNVEVTLSAPPTIPAGTWWLIFWPVMNFSPDGQYGRQGSDTTNGNMAKFINPGGGFGYGTAWQDWTILSPGLQDMAFSFCGTEGSGSACDTLLSENFDSAVPNALPAGWIYTVTNWPSGTEPRWYTNAGTHYPSGIAAHSAPNVGYFNSYSVASPKSARLHYTTPIDLSTYDDSAALKFWMYHDTGYTSSADRVQPQVSTDGGTTWIDVGTAINRYDGTVQWTEHTVDLTAYCGQPSVMIGLHGISGFGNDCHIDDITVEGCQSTGGCSITIAPATLPDATVGLAYSQTIAASGGTAPYTYEVTSGVLPAGLTLNPATGVISGTPTSGGSYTFTITATDSAACTGTITYTINFDYGWNLSVVDDAGRASACLNTDTGYYAWTVLTGFGAGTYVGRSNVTFAYNTYYFQSPIPSGMNLKVSMTTNKASGSYMSPPLRERSICIDANITDNPACP